MDSKEKKQRSSPQGQRATSAGSRRGTATKSRPAPKKTAAPGKKQRQPKRPAPDVVYVQPEPFNRGRFLLRLATVAAVVLALFFGISIFFKVDKVIVSGADKYTAWEVRQASGIEEGENLLSLNEAKIGAQIKTALPYVSRSRVGIKLPDTVNIEIVEVAVTYSVEAENGIWWLMSAEGTLLEKVNSADAEDYTKILGIKLEAPAEGAQAVAKEPEVETTSAATNASGQTVETLPVTVKASEKLSAALDILQYMEDNGILGEAESVDVSDMGLLEIWYGEQYQILLGDTTRLSYKIQMMKNTIEQLGEHYSGVLDVSYTLRPDEVLYTPFA